ncbi:SDR family oxidoreductase [Paenibacillus cremeus]|uniref:SDR family oxidoreductase n=1 Tax=Paenibacillus cremeus TaxID=2163881 RepID=A0A559KGY2_9BACL|nr:SDR family oxidoreductase [Paenibacillus cremeus]TVY11397.1 SDR family oxidoreductase [Paenibacillus cremeus]
MGILEKMRLDGKKALVTGGARGIGKNIAIALVEAGAEVAIVDIDMDEARKTSEELAANGAKTMALQTDVTSPEQVDTMIKDIVRAFGKLDIAFCNAGICMNIPASEMTFEQWKKVIDINLTGVFLTAQAAGKQMIKQGKGGSIINTASMSAHIVNTPQPQCSYNASKAGVIQLTKSLAVEWAQQNIRVNSISPGYIGTELTLNSPTLKPLIEQWNAMSPLHRMGRPEELQAIAVYLAGDTSHFTTGADFIIDGAFTCI